MIYNYEFFNYINDLPKDQELFLTNNFVLWGIHATPWGKISINSNVLEKTIVYLEKEFLPVKIYCCFPLQVKIRNPKFAKYIIGNWTKRTLRSCYRNKHQKCYLMISSTDMTSKELDKYWEKYS